MSEEVLTLPSKPTREAKLLIQEAADTLGQVKNSVRRSESKVYIKNYTGERVMREDPRRFKLIASMRQEGLGMRQTCRAAHCNAATVAAVERLASMSVSTVKARITGNFGQLARMSSERLLEEVGTMNQAQLAVTAGIATDKFLNLIGDPMRIEHTVKHVDGDIFLCMSKLHEGLEKIISAKVVEPLQITET